MVSLALVWLLACIEVSYLAIKVGSFFILCLFFLEGEGVGLHKPMKIKVKENLYKDSSFLPFNYIYLHVHLHETRYVLSFPVKKKPLK